MVFGNAGAEVSVARWCNARDDHGRQQSALGCSPKAVGRRRMVGRRDAAGLERAALRELVACDVTDVGSHFLAWRDDLGYDEVAMAGWLVVTR
jgi:hypothetical protein